jgi:steroid delta-isomerase-like uncharacterized protein
MSEANKAVVRRLFDECLNQHNLDLYPELYSNVVYRAPAMGELRNEEHRHLLDSLFAGFPDAQWTIEDQVAEGDRVVARWTFTGTQKGTFMGVAASGRRLHCTGICIDRLVNGKIVEEWEEWDTLGMMQRLTMHPVDTSDEASLSDSESLVGEAWNFSAKI